MKRLVLLMSILLLATSCGKEQLKEGTPKKENVTEKTQVVDVNEQTETEVLENNMVKPQQPFSSDEEVVSYFRDLEQEVDQKTEKTMTEKLSLTLKNTFITITDFLFYNGEIGGRTFDSLTDSAKQEILTVSSRIDQKIEGKLPGYKETIKDKAGKVYRSATNKIKEGISYLDQKLEEKMGEERYQNTKEQAKEDFGKLKDTAKEVGGTIKDAAVGAKDKVKSWYETFRDKNKE